MILIPGHDPNWVCEKCDAISERDAEMRRARAAVIPEEYRVEEPVLDADSMDPDPEDSTG